MKKASGGNKTSLAPSAATELRTLVGQLRRRLREQANFGDVGPSQLAVLGRLERDGPTTVSTLARAEGMRPQSMGAIVAGLVADDLVTGSPDPADGRQTLLSLTSASLQWIKSSRAAREDWLSSTIENRLNTREQEQLTRAIELLKRIVAP